MWACSLGCPRRELVGSRGVDPLHFGVSHDGSCSQSVLFNFQKSMCKPGNNISLQPKFTLCQPDGANCHTYVLPLHRGSAIRAWVPLALQSARPPFNPICTTQLTPRRVQPRPFHAHPSQYLRNSPPRCPLRHPAREPAHTKAAPEHSFHHSLTFPPAARRTPYPGMAHRGKFYARTRTLHCADDLWMVIGVEDDSI